MRYLRMIRTRDGNVRVEGDEGVRRLFPSIRAVGRKSQTSEEEVPVSASLKIQAPKPGIRTHD